MNEDIKNVFWDRISERAEETIAALQSGRTPRIVRFAVHVTNKCNMNCRYCNEKKSNKTIDRDLFRDICVRAGREGIVHITGGEPMVVPWLEDEINIHKDRTRFALNTNMFILPRIDTMRSIFRLKTSLDDYDRDRWNAMTGGVHFDSVVNNIAVATETVKYTSVCYTATHANSKRLRKFIYFCNEHFPKLFSISVSFYKGTNPDFVLDKNDISILFDSSGYMNPVSQGIFEETHSAEGNYFPGNLDVPCYLSMTERLFDEHGTEYYCSHLFRDHVSAPGNPGKDEHCVTGCNLRFNKYNNYIHNILKKIGGIDA